MQASGDMLAKGGRKHRGQQRRWWHSRQISETVVAILSHRGPYPLNIGRMVLRRRVELFFAVVLPRLRGHRVTRRPVGPIQAD